MKKRQKVISISTLSFVLILAIFLLSQVSCKIPPEWHEVRNIESGDEFLKWLNMSKDKKWQHYDLISVKAMDTIKLKKNGFKQVYMTVIYAADGKMTNAYIHCNHDIVPFFNKKITLKQQN